MLTFLLMMFYTAGAESVRFDASKAGDETN
jgi:hypothetical protein